MRVDRHTVQSHRAAILAAAGRLFRRRGIATVSVADVTRAAGLTHGAFYGHFASKDALAAEACRGSLADAAEKWRQRAAHACTTGRDPLDALIDAYLTERHRDTPEDGCALAALGPEVARAGPPIAGALSAGAAALGAVLEEALAARHPALSRSECTETALAILAALTGGIVLARACSADPDQSRAVLKGTARLARNAARRPPQEQEQEQP
jgi:TetR/AcrR family transcriptional repressor of nem operon